MAKSTMTIDWEDFGQLFGKYHYGNITEPVNGAIERQTKIILDLLDETENKATFFILGMLAKYRKELVNEIANRGHEIALHGQNHEAMFTLTPGKAREDIITSQKIVTDIIGAPVYGYRAPFFSIKKENLYLLETLSELKFVYDSSIFPMSLPRYGINNFSTKDVLYNLPNGSQIIELPMTTAKILNNQIPVSGGGYIRLLPSSLIQKIFKNIEASDKDSMLYMHPYEFDTEAIDVSANYPQDAIFSKYKVAYLNFKWNLFRPSIINKLKALLIRYEFTTCLQKANAIKINNQPVYLNSN